MSIHPSTPAAERPPLRAGLLNHPYPRMPHPTCNHQMIDTALTAFEMKKWRGQWEVMLSVSPASLMARGYDFSNRWQRRWGWRGLKNIQSWGGFPAC